MPLNALTYNPDTGVFRWKESAPRGGRRIGGDIAGSDKGGGYIRIAVDNIDYYAHRLAFLFMEGDMPPNHVDHIDRNPSNNKWCNLRHCTNEQNHHNMKNNAKCVGVTWRKARSSWLVLGVNRLPLGSSRDYFEACCLRKSWEASCL